MGAGLVGVVRARRDQVGRDQEGVATVGGAWSLEGVVRIGGRDQEAGVVALLLDGHRAHFGVAFAGTWSWQFP